MVSALIFDFDGLILDTEMPLYEAWKMTFEHHGVTPIALEEWSQSLGLADGDPAMIDPVQRLRDAVGGNLDLDRAHEGCWTTSAYCRPPARIYQESPTRRHT